MASSATYNPVPSEQEIRAAAQLVWDSLSPGTALPGQDTAGPGEKIVAFTGAGISAESGIPVFRGNEGLWQGFRAEDLATPQAFRRNPEKVWEWYHWRRRKVLEAHPNRGHQALVELEELGLLTRLITQNVDGLHQRAGSREVIELHGNIHRARCVRCELRIPLEEDTPSSVIYCPRCGLPARPDVVWFGEVLPEDAWNEAFRSALACRAMLVIGTSGSVYPAAGLCEVAVSPRGSAARARLIIINPEETALDGLADMQLRGPAGEVLPRLVQHLKELRGAGSA